MRRDMIVFSVAVLLLGQGSTLAMPSDPAFARQDTGDAAEGVVAYTSPAFGFTVSWPAADWALAELDHWSDGWNLLELEHASVEDAELTVLGDLGFDGDPQACLQDFDAFLREDEDISDLQVNHVPAELPATGTIDDAVALYTYTEDRSFSGPTGYTHLFACEELVPGEAVLSLELEVPYVAYDKVVVQVETVAAGITLGGDADRADALQGLYEQTYTNPRWGFTVPLRDDGWTVQVIDHSLNYRQGVELEREASYAWIEAEGYDYETAEELSPQTCLDDALEEVHAFDGVREIAVTRDPQGFAADPPVETTSALVTYALPDDGEWVDYTDYLECRSMDGGLAVLAIVTSSYSDAWVTEKPNVQRLVASITTPAE